MQRSALAGTALLLAASTLPTLAQPAARAGISPQVGGGHRSYSEFSYVTPASLQEGGTEYGDIDTAGAQVSYQVSVPVSDRYSWQAGFEWRGTWFDVPGVAPIPENLQEVSVRLGNTWAFAEDWTLQLMVSPGLYSDFKDIDEGDFNVTGVALFFWQLRERLQLVGGLAFNPRNDVPVIPALGGRWDFADEWTLLAVYPTPRIEYAFDEAWTAFVGAEIVRTAYRVAEDFGDQKGRPELNDEDLSYNEWRVGAGVRWKVARGITVSLDGGWTGEREYVFDDRDVELETDGSPYFQISVSGRY